MTSEETHDEIMQATYDALCDRGYVGLTMADIADRAGKSKSLLHYHYDTKADLLVSFIEHLLSDFEERIAVTEDAPPEERLLSFVEWFVIDPDEDDRAAFHLALLELRAQGAFNEAFSEQLRASDELLRGTVESILREGIESGAFRDVDVEATAAWIIATVDGARTRQITLRTDWYTDAVCHHLLDVLETWLFVSNEERGGH